MRANMLILSIWTLVILSGCIASKVVVESNTFSSSRLPEISVTFPENLQYIGEFKKNDIPSNNNRITSRCCVFVSVGENSEIMALAQVQINHIEPGYWLSNIFYHSSYLSKGVVDIDGFSYQEASWVGNYPESKFINDKGLIIPRKLITRSLARIVDSSNQTLIKISYGEVVPDIKSDDYYKSSYSWGNKDLFDQRQQEIFKAFLERASSATSISHNVKLD